MKLLIIVVLSAAFCCFGQGKKNVIETGTRNASAANWIPPSTTFASPPASPLTGSVYLFTDASSAGNCAGTGSFLAICRWSGSAWVSTTASTAGIVRGFAFVFAPGAAIAPGATVYLTVPIACTISSWSIDSTTAETVTVKLWRVATGGTAIPTVTNSISTSGVSLSSGTHVQSSTVTDFTSTAIAAKDVLAANITAVTASQFVNYTLGCTQ